MNFRESRLGSPRRDVRSIAKIVANVASEFELETKAVTDDEVRPRVEAAREMGANMHRVKAATS
jgi:hypothetical protein